MHHFRPTQGQAVLTTPNGTQKIPTFGHSYLHRP